MKGRITPEKITELEESQVFVFGSNLAGIHGAGAAKLAHDKFGAPWHLSFGHYHKVFAIPTKDFNIQTLPLSTIEGYVNAFIKYVNGFGENNIFLVTEIGCGLAGYKPEQLAPMFRKAIKMENIYLPQRFWDVLNKQ